MVYVALFGAIAMQSPTLGVLYMVLFGLGTVPMMSSVVYLNSFLSVPIRNKIQKAIPYVAICIGILFILRGLGLGIPYVSPSNLSLFVQEQPNCH
jgi:sulfite exporter TauE/SafE